MNESINILVVDDNLENLKVVGNFLKEQGYRIALAFDGKSALSIIENNPIDMVLLDIMMPEMDGFEVCRQIKSKKEIANIPVIFLSAKNNTEDVIRGFELGGADYVTKPFVRSELLMRVKNHLELSAVRNRLIETLQTRDKLYSIIAHDLRTPFVNIANLIDTIKSGIIEVGSDDFFELMQLLDESARKTNALLNNLIDWAKVQSGKLNLNRLNLDISVVIEDCIHLLSGNARVKGISIKSSVQPETFAFFDAITVNTIFRNILSNAIKFTPEGGMITISASESDNYLSVIITDTGVGMSDETIHHIFSRNQSFTSIGTKSENGSGLGLQLVKEMIEQNDAKIRIESELDKGTSFIIEFLKINPTI